jgi:hypothetical protein
MEHTSMARLYSPTTTARLFSTAGTWGEAQIVANGENISLDLQSRIYDTTGHVQREHAQANLSVQTAVRLRQLLGEAIEASLDVSAGRTQPGLWSDATTAAIATRWRRKAAG